MDPTAENLLREIRALLAGTSPTGASKVQGDTANDAADAGNPVKIGGRAEATVATAVADGDRVNGWFDLLGRLVVNFADSSGNSLTNAQGVKTWDQLTDQSGNALTVKWSGPANIAASTSGQIIVDAVVGKKIRVLGLFCVTGGTATDITFESDGTPKTPLIANGVNGGIVLPYNPKGWFETAASEALKATTGAGSTTGVHVQYAEV
jgi:hypothetical protein